MFITKEIELDMGHCVTNHNSKCKHLHGHRYRIIASVDGEPVTTPGASDEGMVIDFSDLKKVMMDVLDAPFDHAFCIWRVDVRAPMLEEAHRKWNNDLNKFHLLDFVPTAENLAKYWFELLDAALIEHNIKLQKLEVFETPTSSAIYTRPTFEGPLGKGLTVDGDVVVHGSLIVDNEVRSRAFNSYSPTIGEILESLPETKKD